jgi:hypothetical protein
MKKLKFKIYSILFSSALLCSALTGGTQNNTKISDSNVVASSKPDCNARNNLGETCQDFIERCRTAGIHNQFPGQFYKESIGAVKLT